MFIPLHPLTEWHLLNHPCVCVCTLCNIINLHLCFALSVSPEQPPRPGRGAAKAKTSARNAPGDLTNRGLRCQTFNFSSTFQIRWLSHTHTCRGTHPQRPRLRTTANRRRDRAGARRCIGGRGTPIRRRFTTNVAARWGSAPDGRPAGTAIAGRSSANTPGIEGQTWTWTDIQVFGSNEAGGGTTLGGERGAGGHLHGHGSAACGWG